MPERQREEEDLFAKRIEELCAKISKVDKNSPLAEELMRELEQVLADYTNYRKTNKTITY